MPTWLREFFQTGAEVVVGPWWLGAEVTRGRGGGAAKVSEFQKYSLYLNFIDKTCKIYLFVFVYICFI